MHRTRLLVGAKSYTRFMTTAVDQAAALVALLQTRPQRLTWPEIAAEVLFSGDALGVWHSRMSDATLIEDPRTTSILVDARAQVEKWEFEGLRMISVLDEEYPSRLRDIKETPPFLFARGELVSDDHGMSVVGSRRASDRGHEIASAAARMLVSKGLTVIAGLAAGIDTTAHRTALDLGGRTVSVIGTGITKYYPAENRALQDEIAERGLVLSQFWPDAPPTRYSFPIRNATMSGYGMGTIVIEAGETSGTRTQARVAVEHGRPVILTDLVVKRTRWGHDLVERPGVHVVSSAAELDSTIDLVLEEQFALTRALASVHGFAPSSA